MPWEVVRLRADTSNERSRPTANRAASNVSHGDVHIVPPTTDLLVDLDALADSLHGRFVVQVTIDADRRRTTVYRSAAAAERAAERANARGQSAHVTLVQMLPVGVVVGVCR